MLVGVSGIIITINKTQLVVFVSISYLFEVQHPVASITEFVEIAQLWEKKFKIRYTTSVVSRFPG